MIAGSAARISLTLHEQIGENADIIGDKLGPKLDEIAL
jgi:hypothetical protein